MSQVTTGLGLPPVTTHSKVPPRPSIMSAAAAGLEMVTTEGSTEASKYLDIYCGPDAIPIQMAVNGALFIFRAM